MFTIRLLSLALAVVSLTGCASGARGIDPIADASVAGSYDLAAPSRDLMAAPTPDLGVPGGCNYALACVNACLARSTDGMAPAACLTDCAATARAASVVLLQTLFTCLESACPSAAMGDVCFDRTVAACVTCYHDNQALMTGLCYAALNTCVADLP